MRNALKRPGLRLTPLFSVEDITSKRQRVKFRCACGREVEKRVSDFIYSDAIECKPCVGKRRMSNLTDEQLAQLRKNAADMKGVTKVPPEWVRLRKRCTCAKARCCNPNNASYANYGGRGITFDFESPSAMADWIVANLGYPKPGQSIDRIDNNKGYTPGNLRWADNETQANNKREYKCSPDWERVRRLQKIKPEFSFERLREFVKEGLTDAQIIARAKTSSGRPRVRYPKLRATE